MTDFAKPEDFSDRAAAADVTHGLAASAEQVKVGTMSALLTAKNATATRRGAWAKVGRVFTPPLDMSKCGALGVWIYGDGKGELLNFQLNNTREYYTAWDDHYVDVNFTGWRYYELLLRERDAQRHQDYVWPYGGAVRGGPESHPAQPGRELQHLLQRPASERGGEVLPRPGQGLAGGEGPAQQPDRGDRRPADRVPGDSGERAVHRVRRPRGLPLA